MLRSLADRLLVCFALAFIAGIVLAANDAAVVTFVCLALSVVVALVTRRRLWLGIVALSLAAAAGALLSRATGIPAPGSVALLPEGGQTIVGTVASAPAYRDGVWRFLLSAEAHEEGGSQQPVGGTCYVRLHSTQRVARGQRWRLTGRLRHSTGPRNPGGRSEADLLTTLGADAMLSAHRVLAQPLGSGHLGRLSRHAFLAQQLALRALQRHVGQPYPDLTAAVAGSVVFGVHAAPPPEEVADDFRHAGTMHLLVVSGSMVSLVFGMVFLPGAMRARAQRWRQRQGVNPGANQPSSGRGQIRRRPGPWAAVIAAAIVVYYAIITEGGQAVWRAAIAALLVSLSFSLRRVPAVAKHHPLTPDRYTLLAAAAIIILALQPAALFSASFQLTFAAVLGLLYLTPAVQPLLSPLFYRLALPALGTVAAQLAVFPVMTWHFQYAPVAGFVANLAAVPLAAVILAAGLLTCALDPILPALAVIPGWITGWATRGLIWVSSGVATLSWSSPEMGRPAVWMMMLWYAALASLGWMLVRARARPVRGRP